MKNNIFRWFSMMLSVIMMTSSVMASTSENGLNYDGSQDIYADEELANDVLDFEEVAQNNSDEIKSFYKPEHSSGSVTNEEEMDADNNEDEYVELTGYIISMGVNFDIEPNVYSENATIWADCLDESTENEFGEKHRTECYVEKNKGSYKLRLLKGKKYNLYFHSYSNALLTSMMCMEEGFSLSNNSRLNFVVQTKNVLGFGGEDEKYIGEYAQYKPYWIVNKDNSSNKAHLVDRLFAYKGGIDSSQIKLNLSLTSVLRKQRKIDDDDIVIRSRDGYWYEKYDMVSSDNNVATVDEDGILTAVGTGSTEVTVYVPDTLISTREDYGFNVDVKEGFDAQYDCYYVTNWEPDLYAYNWKWDVNNNKYYDFSTHDYEKKLALMNHQRFKNVFKKIDETMTTNYYFENYGYTIKEKEDTSDDPDVEQTGNPGELDGFKGLCGGMAITAGLFNEGILDIAKEKDQIDTKYKSLYECDFYDASRVDNRFLVESEKTLTLMEQFQAIQSLQIYSSSCQMAEIEVEKLVKEWDPTETYILNMRNNDNTEGHYAVIDNSGEKPELINDTYNIEIYDVNKPKTKETVKFEIEENRLIYNNWRYSYDAQLTADGEEQTEWTGTSDDGRFHIIKLSDFIKNFFGDGKKVEFNGKLAFAKQNEETAVVEGSFSGNLFIKNKNDEVLLEVRDGVIKTIDESVTKNEYLGGYVLGQTTEDAREIYYVSQNDIKVEAENKKYLKLIDQGNVKVAKGDSTNNRIRIEGDTISVQNESDEHIQILQENRSEGGKILSVLSEGDTPKGNEITCQLSEDGKYSLKAKESYDSNLTLNTEDQSFEQSANYTANNNNEAVDIKEYINNLGENQKPEDEKPGDQKPGGDDYSTPESENGGTQNPNLGLGNNESATSINEQKTDTISVIPKKGVKVTKDKISYYVTVSNDKTCEVEVTKVDAKLKKIKIPEYITIDNTKCKVVSIRAKACKNCKNATSLIIGKNVRKIGNSAFEKCTKLKKVVIPKNVEEIGSKAFYNCKALKSVSISSTKLKKIGKRAFGNIAKGSVIKLPKNNVNSYRKLLSNKYSKGKTKVK